MTENNSFSRKRPSFSQFREWFMAAVHKHAAERTNGPLTRWHSVGSEEQREKIIDTFLNDLEVRYGFRPVFQEQLHKLDCPLESVANHIFHVFSTMYLVEHINAKMYGKAANNNRVH